MPSSSSIAARPCAPLSVQMLNHCFFFLFLPLSHSKGWIVPQILVIIFRRTIVLALHSNRHASLFLLRVKIEIVWELVSIISLLRSTSISPKNKQAAMLAKVQEEVIILFRKIDAFESRCSVLSLNCFFFFFLKNFVETMTEF
jgi:hypothetical protein